MSKALALVPAVEATLSVTEKERLDVLEGIVEEGKVSFLAVGRALIEIRQTRLYRASAVSFDLYAKERFGYQPRYAFYLQGAATCADVLHDRAVEGTSEWTLRPLTRLIDLRSGNGEPTEEQKERLAKAWMRAGELAGDKAVTRKHVKEAVEELALVAAPAMEEKPNKKTSRRLRSHSKAPCEGMKRCEQAESAMNLIRIDDLERAKAFAHLRRWCDAHE